MLSTVYIVPTTTEEKPSCRAKVGMYGTTGAVPGTKKSVDSSRTFLNWILTCIEEEVMRLHRQEFLVDVHDSLNQMMLGSSTG